MFIGIDLGTSGVKVLLMDEAQRIVGSTSAALTVSRPHAGWSEQAPADWISATRTAMEALKAAYPAEVAKVQGIGLSGQMHGACLLDKDDNILRPCILWNDTRSHQEAAELDATEGFREISGNIVFPGFTAPKLVWVARNEPEIFEKTAKVLLPKDYLRLWLTGEYASDMSDASGTSWLDVAGRCWSVELLSKSGMRRDQMPDLVEGSDVSGQLRAELAQAWGIDGDVVVAGGAGDNAASAVGIGATAENEAFISLGTSGVIFAATDSFRPNPASALHAFCHALPQKWHQMGVILSATAALSWFAQITGKTEVELTEALGPKLHAPGRTMFLPYLSGERTPHNSAAARGAFLGLENAGTRETLTQAVVEGVSFALRDNLEVLKQGGGAVESAIAVGGGSRAGYWLKALATAMDIEIEVPVGGDFGAAFGAARLGLLAATGASIAEVCRK
ncbi:MAG TPA: xylulokinase, partial [Paracoccaceae bacterium]|nr:xylulokinase [Paracoccaceae bacterium]